MKLLLLSFLNISGASVALEVAQINQIAQNWSNLQKINALHSAVLNGYVHATRSLLENHIHDYDQLRSDLLNDPLAERQTDSPYELAIFRGNPNSLQIIKLLNQQGIDFNPHAFALLNWASEQHCFDEIVEMFDIHGFTEMFPLILGPRIIRVTLTRKLLERGVNFDGFVAEDGRNALMLALDLNEQDLSKRLFYQMSDVNARDNRGRSALDRCILNPKTLSQVKGLIEEASGQYYSIVSAFLCGNVDDVSRCLAAKANPNEYHDGAPIIYQFLFARRYDEVILIAQAGACVNYPFRECGGKGSIKYLRLLSAAYEQALEGLIDHGHLLKLIEYLIPKTVGVESFLERPPSTRIPAIDDMIREFLEK